MLCLSFVAALGACGDNSDSTAKEDCSTTGDEDGNGLADCADPACSSAPACNTAVCGNGTKETGEDCDDGNTTAGDGCSATCKTEVCGNHVVDPGEMCDDGNTTNGDGCSATCKDEACGNGIVDTAAGETCDDGNAVDGDGCDSNCTMTICGNGIVTTGETCDDGNATDGDGCDHNCTATACGNGVMTTGEACDDGNAVDGDGCDSNCTATACGNGVMTTGEICDDGNTVNGDGCDNNCTISGCGNGVVGGTEQCDDGNTINGDACDNNCTTPACGNGIVDPLETCDDGNTTSGDGCSATCHSECGNGVVDTGETCDDGNVINGDGCDNNCKPTGCGNGVVSAGEQCDDGNAVNGDGCSAACRSEFNEIEPNEDGTPSVGAPSAGTTPNDVDTVAFANATANGSFPSTLGEVHIRALLSPAGDEDIFLLTNPGTTPIDARLDIWNMATGYGYGVPCGTSIDTVLRIYDAAGVSQASDDDRASAADRCSGLNYTIPAGASIFAHVMYYNDATAINAPGYGLQVKFTPIVCGDGVVAGTETCDDGNATNGDGCDNNCKITACGNGIVTGTEVCDDGNTVNGDGCDNNCKITACGNGVVTTGEQCDDGNSTNGDGCSATCQLEGGTAEIEPNDTVMQADVSTLQVTGDTDIRGTMGSATDVDTFKVTVVLGTVVRMEILTQLSPADCVGGTADMRLLDAAGATIVEDTGSTSEPGGYGGIGQCGAVTMYLAPGTYYAQVRNGGNGSAYFLQIDFQDDKGAESEAANTMGVNDTIATASTNFGNATSAFVYGDHQLNADYDYYAIQVPAGYKIRLETVEGDRAVETCEGLDLDSRIVLYDQTGAQLVDDDDDGRGYCSLIDGTGTTPHDSAAKNATATMQTYYVAVRQSSGTSTSTLGKFKYRLSYTTRP